MLLLLNREANVNFMSGKYCTAVIAATIGPMKGIRQLQKQGAKPVEIVVALESKKEIIRRLHQRGAKLNIIGEEYETALRVAMAMGSEDMPSLATTLFWCGYQQLAVSLVGITEEAAQHCQEWIQNDIRYFVSRDFEIGLAYAAACLASIIPRCILYIFLSWSCVKYIFLVHVVWPFIIEFDISSDSEGLTDQIKAPPPPKDNVEAFLSFLFLRGLDDEYATCSYRALNHFVGDHLNFFDA